MKKALYLLPLLIVIFGLVANLFFVPAVSANTSLKDQIKTNTMKVGEKGFGDTTDPTSANQTKLQQVVGNVIKIVLGFLGIVMVIIIVYAGFLWMTAGGESDQVKKAKDWMLNAAIGLLITIAAYSISSFVISKVFEATEGAV